MRERDLKKRYVAPSLILLKSWKQYDKSLAHVVNLMPQVVKKKRRKLDDGSFEEYFDYLFKDGDEGNQKMLNLLKKAQEWRQKMQTQASGT